MNLIHTLFESSLYLCFLAYKSAIEILVANVTNDIIIASGINSTIKISGTEGVGKLY